MPELTESSARPAPARHYRQCSISVLDTLDDPNMRFDSEGRCHYYHEYVAAAKAHLRGGEEGERQLQRLADQVRASGRNKPYDSIIGLSGGVDSTYLAYLANELGLRPLAVHFDNGWNSEISVRNVENTVNRLGLDLHTLVVNWDEFRDLQLAYLLASVVDIEVPTDHAIAGTLYRLAVKHRVRYVLSGSNVVTESVLPRHWVFNKLDHVNLLDIHRQFGRRELETYPLFGTIQKKLVNDIFRVNTIAPLNLVPYNYENAKEIISEELGWRNYGGKHHESTFTRFYQCYILPRKFEIDKRKAHLSNLIFSGQLQRSEALKTLVQPPCGPDVVESDRAFFLKKLGLTEATLERMMAEPPRSHFAFKTERALADRWPVAGALRPLWHVAKTMLRQFERPVE